MALGGMQPLMRNVAVCICTLHSYDSSSFSGAPAVNQQRGIDGWGHKTSGLAGKYI